MLPISPSLRATLTGVGLACLSTSLGGVTVVLTRFVIVETDALTLAFVRYGIASLFLAAVLLATTRIPRIPRRDLIIISVLGVIMFTGFPFFMARALEDTTAARGALIFATMPLATIILGALFRVESLTWIKSIAVAIAMTGTALALGERVGAAAPDALRGDVFMFAAILVAAAYNVLARRYLIRYGVLAITVWTMLLGSLVLMVLAFTIGGAGTGALDFSLRGWIIMLALAIPGAALMTFAYGKALELITPMSAAITVGLNPLTAILLGAIVLSEPVTVRVVIGFILTVVGILLANWRPRRASRASRV
ncbi:MAG: DMT family transporter [Alphaproteobacteria bacterium]|nr:DMT family transporter [Alphaproteobacteria bacterium]